MISFLIRYRSAFFLLATIITLNACCAFCPTCCTDGISSSYQVPKSKTVASTNSSMEKNTSSSLHQITTKSVSNEKR